MFVSIVLCTQISIPCVSLANDRYMEKYAEVAPFNSALKNYCMLEVENISRQSYSVITRRVHREWTRDIKLQGSESKRPTKIFSFRFLLSRISAQRNAVRHIFLFHY
jgi:hypothetical protein